MVTPPQVIQGREEDDDDQSMENVRLEELEESIHGQPYVPDHYEDNIYFHGSELQYPEGSPAEMHNEDSVQMTHRTWSNSGFRYQIKHVQRMESKQSMHW